MSQPGDFILVYFLDEQPVGKRFAKKRNDWPLHVTLVSWYTIDDYDIMIEIVELSARYSQALQLTLGEDTDFSPDTRVSVIANQEEPAMLHGVLLATLEEAGASLRDKQWTGENYTAHVTHHDTQPTPELGDVLHVDTFSLVQLLPDNICEVVRNIPIGGAS